MMKALFFALLIGGTLNLASAQPVITNTDLLGLIGNVRTLESDTRMSFGVNVGTAGANRTWDYSSSSIPSPLRISYELIAPSGTPFDSDFPQANLVQHIIDTVNAYELYNYYQVTPTGFANLGSGSILGPPIDTMFVEHKRNSISPLPLMYGSRWTTIENDTSGSFPAFANVSIDTARNRVDAWGAVILPTGSFQCLRIRSDFKYINHLIIGGNIFSTSTETGIQYNWVSRNAFTVLNIQSLDGATDSNFTMARGLTWLSSSPSSVGRVDGLIPETFALRQNYPNPFNPSTVIEFSLPRSGKVELAVFDLLGRKIATLAEGIYDPGTYRAAFAPDALASGTYIYTLRTEEGTLTQRMLLLK